jgi:hypothetical protein
LSKTISQVSPSELAATSKTLHRLAEAPGQDSDFFLISAVQDLIFDDSRERKFNVNCGTFSQSQHEFN